MITKIDKNSERIKRHKRIRNKISGTPERPRLSVFRSTKHIYAQIIDEFMIGDDLLVAPVLAKGAVSREVVLPPGKWRDASGVVHAGPARISVDAPLGRLPHFVRVP